MADKTVMDSRPNQISKDLQGSDNSIPLSPQWLLPKPGENKTGVLTGENLLSQLPVYANHSNTMKSPGEDLRDDHKKKDVFRPSVLDMESSRRDRWRDEERDTNSSVRKDRWREGDKDVSDNRKDRWTDSSGRHYGEARRAPVERWNDSGNRENSHDQRRESKWNTRWGPDEKETDHVGEKWVDSGKDADMLLDKGPSHPAYHGKDDREGDNHRPWRSNSAYSRGRVEPPHHQTSIPNKQVPTFVHGRGRGENPAPTFSLGRGRVGSGGSSVDNTSIPLQPLGFLSERDESGQGEPYLLRYSRTKLLDVYRTTEMKSRGKFLDGIVQVPSLTKEEPVEPLAFCAPTPEELVILKGINKGEIMSSGAPQIIKDGSVGRNTTDSTQSRQSKLGSRDDLPLALDDSNNETMDSDKGSYSESFLHEKQMNSWPNAKVETVKDYQAFSDHKLNTEALKEDNSSYRKNSDMPTTKESSILGHSSILHAGTWRSSSFAERMQSASHDWREISTEVQKDLNNARDNNLTDSSYAKKGLKWPISDDSVLRRQSSAVFDRELETHKVSQPSPEGLVLYYKDPQGEIQGPFAGSDIIAWFEAGYFGIDLQVRLAGAPADSPFALLGDVMPHLRAKAQPPPGFNTPKPSEIRDASGRLIYNSIGKLHAGLSEAEMMNEPRYKHGSSTQAENQFIESLMSGNMSSAPLEKFAPSEGMPGYIGTNSSAPLPLGADGGDALHLLAKKMALERQKSLPNPFSYWPGGDAASLAAKTHVVNDSLAQQKLLSSIADNTSLLHPQNVELMSILQGLPERSMAGVNNGTGGWSNFPVQGGLDPLQDKLDMQHGQNFPAQAAFGIQHQRPLPQNPPLTNLLAQSIDTASSMLTPEKLLSSGISQDPQLLTLLQQQYLLQLQSHAPVASQQLSLLDKLLLIKQQQRQEEQQHLLRQQQQLLTQVLSEHHHQQFGEPSQGQLRTAGLSAGNASLNHALFQPPHELLQIGSQIQVPNLQDERASNVALPPSCSQDISPNDGSEMSSDHLPHQPFENSVHQRSWGAALPEQIDNKQQEVSLTETAVINTLSQSEMANIYTLENTLLSGEALRVITSDAVTSFPPEEHLGKSVALQLSESCENELLIPDKANEVVAPTTRGFEEPQDIEEQQNEFSSVVKEVKSAETSGMKKSLEKKSKKQKSLKAQSSDLAKGISKTQQSKSSEFEGTTVGDVKSETETVSRETLAASVPGKGERKTDKVREGAVDFLPGQNSLPACMPADDAVTAEIKGQPGQVASVSQLSTQAPSGRAWKPAPGFKPKSLLEIQQEEQRRVQEQRVVAEISTSLSTISVSTPWAGVVANSDGKVSSETLQDAATNELNLGKTEGSLNHKSKKSHLHDLYLENDVAKTNERETKISDNSHGLPSVSLMSLQTDSVDDTNFIEAKDTKKSRRKSSKAKGAGAKASVPLASPDVLVRSSSIDKGKSSRQIQQEKEVLPAIPSGPSLGDFVVWKDESANPSPAQAWSTDSAKLLKPTSLRDILKEQERKASSGSQAVPMQTPQKPAPSQPARGGGPSWSISSLSPAKAASPLLINSQASSQPKNKVEDDLFWGPSEQPKQEAKQSDFPQLGKQSSWGSKSTPVKATPGGSMSRQKALLSSSPATAQSSVKGKNDSLTKHSEAMDFKEWCENECVRLIRSKDTSFLEFCLKQSREEAEMFLIQNLGPVDPEHKFIDKFLNYKDFLPVDVIDIAFPSRNDRKVTGFGVRDTTSDYDDVGGSYPGSAAANDGATKGGKKKGKKGKKVSPSVLGFNVVSNRIMMGEIQAVED